MPPEIEQELWHIVPSIIYFIIGCVLFAVSIRVADKLVPFSIRKEIEEDENTSLGIIIGSGLIAMAIILSAAIK